MAGVYAAAKQIKFARRESDLSRVSALTSQPRIWLQLVDDRNKVIEPDNPFKLKTRARISGPDHIGFNPSDHWQADNDAVAAMKLARIIDHEAMRGKVADMQVQVTVHKMFDDGRKVDRVARRAPQIGYTEVSSTSHALRSFPRSGSKRTECRRKPDNW